MATQRYLSSQHLIQIWENVRNCNCVGYWQDILWTSIQEKTPIWLDWNLSYRFINNKYKTDPQSLPYRKLRGHKDKIFKPSARAKNWYTETFLFTSRGGFLESTVYQDNWSRYSGLLSEKIDASRAIRSPDPVKTIVTIRLIDQVTNQVTYLMTVKPPILGPWQPLYISAEKRSTMYSKVLDFAKKL